MQQRSLIICRKEFCKYEISNFNSGILLSLPTDCSTRTTFWDTVHPWYRLTQILNRTESISSKCGIWESSACGTVGREREKNRVLAKAVIRLSNFDFFYLFFRNLNRNISYENSFQSEFERRLGTKIWSQCGAKLKCGQYWSVEF